MIKKFVLVLCSALLLCFVFCACGSDPKTPEDIELTADRVDGVSYGIPAGWTKETYEFEGVLYLQNTYYPDEENKDNAIDVKCIRIDNAIYTTDQAEQYLVMLMDSFYSENSGYTMVDSGSYYDSDIPARYSIVKVDSEKGEITVTSYCFMINANDIVMISYWHTENSDEDYSIEFEACLESVDIENPEFIRGAESSSSAPVEDEYDNNDSAEYNESDPYYSENDHNNDGRIDGDEFQDSLNDAIGDYLESYVY